ncbi:MAG TPA: Crp/Fnr family transcriptional regulator [Terriglobia bacterium]|nr:Crp/Fnr family transcriptional regulator [Terriglobia bacterium]
MKKSPRRSFKFSFGHDHLFGTLKPEMLEAFRKNQVTQFFPANALVLGAGETPKGIYVIRSGKIKLSLPGRGSGGPTSRVAGRGEILGLSAMVSGKPCEVASQTLTAAELTFIPRNAIIRLMDEDSDFAFRVLQYLCNDLGDAFENVRAHLRPHRRNPKGT